MSVGKIRVYWVAKTKGNMRIYGVLIILCFVVVACQKEKSKQPQVDLSRLIFDLQTAKVAVEKSVPDQKDSLSYEYHRQILEIHDLTESELDEIIEAFEASPKLMDSIYLKVNGLIDSLKEVR